MKRYDERQPVGVLGTSFYRKNFIGNASGIKIQYKAGRRSVVAVGYERTVNLKKRNYNSITDYNDSGVNIRNFKLRHIGNYFFVYYGRQLFRNIPKLKVFLGPFITTTSQQELDVYEALDNSNLVQVYLDERSYKTSNLMEGGIMGGIEYMYSIDAHFDLGVKAKVYYDIFIDSFDAITLTPTLTYSF